MLLSNGERLFHWPLAQHVITAGWTYSDGSAHSAIDLRAAVGTPVYAAEPGTVNWVQNWDGRTKTGNQSYGNLVRIKHANYNGQQLETYYAHLSRMLVKSGQTVTDGQLIGYSGETGNCYGAHLHFEVRLNRTRVHPLNWLDSDFSCANAGVKTHLGSYTSVQRPAASSPDKQPATPLQMMCIVDADADVLARAKESGLSIEQRTGYLIGPVSSGDAMTIWGMAQADGCRYFASSRDGGLQQLCVVAATNDIVARARELSLPVTVCNVFVIGPASMGDAMAIWQLAQAAQYEYFASYTEV